MIKYPAICKTRNIGTGNGMRETGNGWMFTRIPGNLLEDSGEYSRRFRRIFQKILGNVSEDPGDAQEDSRECSRRFGGMLPKIPRNVQEDSGN